MEALPHELLRMIFLLSAGILISAGGMIADGMPAFEAAQQLARLRMVCRTWNKKVAPLVVIVKNRLRREIDLGWHKANIYPAWSLKLDRNFSAVSPRMIQHGHYFTTAITYDGTTLREHRTGTENPIKRVSTSTCTITSYASDVTCWKMVAHKDTGMMEYTVTRRGILRIEWFYNPSDRKITLKEYDAKGRIRRKMKDYDASDPSECWDTDCCSNHEK